MQQHWTFAVGMEMAMLRLDRYISGTLVTKKQPHVDSASKSAKKNYDTKVNIII